MMQYREMKRLGMAPSLLGFGCMRFHCEGGDLNAAILEEEAEALIDRAMAAGVNYYDTAYPYHNGQSEPFLGRVMRKYDRSTFYFATKLPIWQIETREDAVRCFEDQLARLQTDYIDFYLIHALNAARWEKVQQLGLIELFEGYKAQGKIRAFGFSFHDTYETFEKILTAHDWDFCQIQLNDLDAGIQAGVRGAQLCEARGVPLVIMEPLKGSALATLPDGVTAPMRACHPDRSAASWGMRWVAGQPAVHVILSGMNTPEQLEDNLATLSEAAPLNEEERAIVEQVADEVRHRVKNGCTNCQYCMPCPFGVNIPFNFGIWNIYGIGGDLDYARRRYAATADSEKASVCKKCGACEGKCPQGIHIREDLAALAAELG